MSEEVEMASDTPAADVSKAVDSNDKLLALAAHLGPFSGVGYFLIPLIIYLVKKDSRFVTHHARQAMVYQGGVGIFMSLMGVAGAVLSFFTAGIATIIVVPGMLLLGLVFCIFPLIAAVKAFNGQNYPYPVSGAWAEKLGN